MPLPFALLRAGSLAFGLTLAGTSLAADGYSARDAQSNPVNLLGKTLGTTSIGGTPRPNVLPYTAVTDPSGNAFTTANPFPVAPGIAVATPVDRGGAITVANGSQPVMGANAARKGGWIVADPANAGAALYVSYTGAANTTGGAGVQCVMTPGGSCPLTVNGYVIQTAVTIAGPTAGDRFEAVEFQ